MNPGPGDALVATALFADISGFTTLADRLDPESLHEVISPVISRLAAVAERNGGFIAKYAGDALLVLFGVPDPEPDHADRAVRTAARMHAELAELLPVLPPAARDLTLHVGVETGEVVAGMVDCAVSDDPSILGDAVIRAQAIESKTPSGETFVGDAVVAHALVGDGLAVFEPVEGVRAWRLKSVPEAIEADAYDAGAFAAQQVASRLDDAALEERRLVTVLFADVVGFRALADRLSPQELHEVVSPLIRRLGAVAERYDGFTARFAGDAFLAFFGAPVSHEDDATRALLAAIDMHHEMEAAKAELPPAAAMLRLRIGVNSGDVVSGEFGGERRTDYSVLGDAVNTAQRLESVAAPGATYVGELTHELTVGAFEFESLGGLTLKGKPQPVPAWRLVSRREHAARGRHGRPAAPLFGRGPEVQALSTMLEALAGGRGGVVTVIGEPGVGKSRLASEAERLAHERGIRWLTTRCVSYGSGLAYWPYAELVRRAYGIGIEDTPAEASRRLTAALQEVGVPDAAPYFARLIGVEPAGSNGIDADPEAFRRGLHRSFAAVVGARAARVPVVIEIEDAHWADESSLELTRELARLSREVPLLLYVTGRPEADERLAHVRAAASADGAVHVDLRPLDDEAIGELVDWTLGGAAPPELLPAVAERTGGNPFFAEEMVLSLRDAGSLTSGAGRWTLARGWNAEEVPRTVEGVLSARIDLLPKRAADVLQTASVIGRRVRLGLLRAVSGDGPALDGVLERLLDDGFLDPVESTGEEELQFHHALIVDVAYSRIVRRKRTALHLRIAEAGERLYGAGDEVIDLLARHHYLGGSGPAALPYLRRAGERARRLFANREAILHLSRAAEVCRAEPACAAASAELLLDLAELHDLVGDYDEALELFREVRDDSSEVRAWRGMAAVLRKRGQYDDVFELLDRAVAQGRLADGDLAPLWLERGWSLCISGRYAEGAEALRAGLTVLGDRDDPVRGHLLLQLARAEATLGERDAALSHATSAQEEFERRTDLRGLATAFRIAGEVHASMDRQHDALSLLGRGLEAAERVGVSEEIGGCLINMGFAHCNLQDYDAAIECDLRAIEEFERAGHEFGRATGYANLADHLVRSGRAEEAREKAQAALRVAQEIGFTATVADASITLAKAESQLGDHGAAAEHAERGATMFEEMGYGELAEEGFTLAADAAERLGDEERARALRSRTRSLEPSSGS